MGVPRLAGQDQFDAAVQENIDEFDMECEEAVSNALEELKLQGLDISGINTTGAAAQDAITEKASSAAAFLKAAVQGAGQHGAGLHTALQQLAEALQPEEDLPALLKAAIESDAVASVLHAVSIKGCQPEEGLQLMQALLGSSPSPGASRALEVAREGARQAFFAADGVRKVAALLPASSSQPSLVKAAAATLAAACTKHEENKCSAVDSGSCSMLVASLRQTPDAGAVRAVCALVRSVTTADDPRPPASRCFQNARMLSKAGGHLTLLQLLPTADEQAVPGLIADICMAIKKLAVNDDICKELADAGALDITLPMPQKYLSYPAVCKACCALLRQLANSDSIRTELVERGALNILQTVVHAHLEKAGTLEQALGLLTALLLRSPSAAEKAVECGCGDTVLEVLSLVDSSKPTPEWQWVHRQACMALRNVVARSTQLRAGLLEKGAEELLRKAMRTYPQACGDVGSGALRDLGLEDYQIA